MFSPPIITSQHLKRAELFATRADMAMNLKIPRKGKIAEVGVALGQFSQFLIDQLDPLEFHAFDYFALHEEITIWGKPTKEVLNGMSHADFYRSQMVAENHRLKIHQGFSSDTLVKCEDKFFDMIYIDAGHRYDEVKLDGEITSKKVKDDGILIFNDYIMYDHLAKADYGVVQVVNEMVVNDGWSVIGFALQQQMFCDIALQRF